MNKKSLVKLKALAAKGEVDAQCWLADYYLDYGNKKGYRSAIPWLKKASELGDPWAQYELGLAYQEGLGVSKNIRQAMQYYNMSAEQGFDGAIKPRYNLRKPQRSSYKS